MTKKSKKDKDNKVVSYGVLKLPPVVPGQEVRELCNKIDVFYNKYPKQHKKQKASDLIKGAFYAMRPECRSNPDWMSQSANSAREVLYPFWGGDNKSSSLIEVLKKYSVDKLDKEDDGLRHSSVEIKVFEELELIYRKLTDITHHGVIITKKGFSSDEEYLQFSEDKFDDLILNFVSVLNKVLILQQIDIHRVIGAIVLRENWTESLKKDLDLILNVNYDAKAYFFTKVPEKRSEWLWDNNFLEILKTKAKNKKIYRYTTPEINYLLRSVEKNPAPLVNKIILSDDIATSENKFRPELVEQILRICAKLPSELLIKVIPKIKKQNWVKLMSSFGQWGFEYEKMFEILHKAEKIDELIDLAEVVLSVKSKTEFDKDTFDKNPFYIRDFSYTKVFEYLEKIKGENKKKVLKLLTDVTVKIAILGEENEKKESAFKIGDTFYLYDVDFFKDEYKELKHRSYRDSVKDLMLFVAKIAKDLIEEKCENENEIREIFDKYLGSFDSEKAKLPDTRAMWQLRLFVLSLCPNVFKDEIKKSLFRLFEERDRYVDVKSGAEYEQLLKSNFDILDVNDQKKYEEEVFKLFDVGEIDDADKQKYIKNSGAKLLYLIGKKDKAKEIFGVDFGEVKYEPAPTIQSSGFAHSIISQSPITQEEFDKKSIEEILKLLKTEWTPEKLNAQNENKDFHRPKNAEGAGDLLQAGINNRFELFIENAEKFFDKGEIDEHYTQSFLRGIQDAIKNGKKTNTNEWQPLIDLMKNLVDAKLENRKREEGSYDTWLANWQTVYYTMTGVLQELLSEKGGEVVIGNFGKYRDDLLHILKFLLRYKNDPKPEDEKTESAKSKTSTNDGSMIISDPYSIAINSVRGETFQAFLMFIYQDGKKLEKEKIKIEKNVEDLYEEILKEENTRAMMFMYGHHLPTFYFRDEKWTKEVLIPQIFKGEKDEYLKLASIEGYLTQTLYKEIFEDDDFKKLYEGWISLENTKYPNQKHFKDVDEALAIHMALAFINFDVDIEDGLVKIFWHTDNPNNQVRYYEFISFVGRSVLTRGNISDNWLKEGKISKEKLFKFWDWALKNIDNKKVLSGFGHWINPNTEVLDDSFVVEKIAETLKKSDGDIDWDYGLIQRLVKFAKIDPNNTLLIIKSYLLDKNGDLNQNRRIPMFSIDKEIKEALGIIYQKPDLKQEISRLINQLVQKGSSLFWGLESILE